MRNLLHSHSPLRIFGISSLITLAALVGVLCGMGPGDTLVILILIVVEIAFSFDNAIINAKILSKLSTFWQTMFLTVGMIIAVVGMRVVFPLLIVSVSAHLSWGDVVNLALHHPHEYAHQLDAAHPAISAFGGAFLMVLALEFFIDDRRKVVWLRRIERPLQSISRIWVPAVLSLAAVGIVAIIPANHHASTTLVAGALGVASHIAIQLFMQLFGRGRPEGSKTANIELTGLTAFWAFVYLQILDASFSFDGVIGAFAITTSIVLIAIGLGVGALWVRSLTVFLVRKGTLDNYIYLEHGAHYTIGVLAVVLLLGTVLYVPDILTGLVGIGIIGSSVVASRQALQARRQ